jgi:TldD protein
VKNGVYCVNLGGKLIDITSKARTIGNGPTLNDRNGKLGAPLKGAMLIGNGPTDLGAKRHAWSATISKLDTGVGTAARNGQGVPVGVGQPTLRMDRITVGGTG